MLSGNARYLGRFFAWWLGELRACVPNALLGAGERLEITLDTGAAHFAIRRNGDAREVGSVELGANLKRAPEKAARKLLRRSGASTEHATLRLPAGQLLRSKVELPIAAAENLREVLALEMDRHTPFSSDEVLFDFQVAGSDAELQRLSIELLVARKHDIEEALALARTMGLSPDRVTGPESKTGATETFNLLPQGERPRPSRAVPRLMAAMAIVTLVLGGLTLGIGFERKQRTLERFESRVAELRAATGETGKLEEKLARLLAVSGYLREQKKRRPQMIEILDEVTRRLPDKHWLISYSLRDGTIRLAGYSDDPSSVLRLLEQSELFSEARFGAPVTMDPRVGKERFNLVATVAREDGAQ